MKSWKKMLSVLFVFAFVICLMNIMDMFVYAADTEQYKVVCTAGVKLRSSYSTSSEQLTSIANGKTFTVTEKYKSGGYYWGKTTYNGKTGWTALLKTNHSEIYSQINGTYYHNLRVWVSGDKTSGNSASSPYYAGTSYYFWARLTDPLFKSQTVLLTDVMPELDVDMKFEIKGPNSFSSSHSYSNCSENWYGITPSNAGTYTCKVTASGDANNSVSASFTINSYTISFNSNGGSCSTSSKTVTNGATYGTLPTPTKNGCTFNGWYTSSVGGNKITSSTKVNLTSNQTLYAHWTDNTKPTGSLSSTNNRTTSQTVTLGLSDNVGIAGYYWGTSSSYSSNTYTSTSLSSVTKTVSSSGTYYLTVKDTSGNLSNTVSLTFYKTTLNAGSGSVSPSYVITRSGNSFTMPTPTRSGYVFAGWSTSSSATSGSYTAGATYTPSVNSTLYAIWLKIENTMSLGTNYATSITTAGDYKYYKYVPTSSGEYSFATLGNQDTYGYLYDSEMKQLTYDDDGGNDRNCKVTYNLTSGNTYYYGVRLYSSTSTGSFKTSIGRSTYNVNYNRNDGSGSMTSAVMEYGVNTELSSNTFTRTGYNFLGWSTNSTAASADFVDGESVVNLSSNGSTVNLYAIWEKNTYKVSYNANGGSGAPSSQTKTYGQTLTLSGTKPTRSGYTFLGWSTSSSATSVTYNAGGSFTENNSVTLYAVWMENITTGSTTVNISTTAQVKKYSFTPSITGTYIISSSGDYDTYGGIYESIDSSGNLTDELETDDDGGNGNNFSISHRLIAGTTYFISAKMYSSSSTGSFNLNLSLKYNTILFDPNGGSGGLYTMSVLSGENDYFYTAVPYKSFTITFDDNFSSIDARQLECEFLGWYDTNTGNTYEASDTININEDTTLFAQWYEPQIGTLPTPTRNGYVFSGWYLDNGTRVYSTTTIDEDTTLYANWTRNAYIINYYANGGSNAPSSQTMYSGESVTLTTAVPNKKYRVTYNVNGGNSLSTSYKDLECVFDNWYDEESGNYYYPGQIVSENRNFELYAQWANPQAGTLPTTTRSNYNFVGWYTSATGGTRVYSTTSITKNTTIYAHWERIPETTAIPETTTPAPVTVPEPTTVEIVAPPMPQGLFFTDNMLLWQGNSLADFYYVYVDGWFVGETASEYYYFYDEYFVEGYHDIWVSAVRNGMESEKARVSVYIEEPEETTTESEGTASTETQITTTAPELTTTVAPAETSAYPTMMQETSVVPSTTVEQTSQKTTTKAEQTTEDITIHYPNDTTQIPTTNNRPVHIETTKALVKPNNIVDNKNNVKNETTTRKKVKSGKVSTKKGKEKANKKKTKTVVKLAKPMIKKLKNKRSKKILVTWKKAKSVDGYMIQYYQAKKTKLKRTRRVDETKKSIVLKGFKKNKRYYVRIRTYKIIKSKQYYSKWSKAKSIKIRK